MPPNYAAYKATNALLGLKAAYEKAQKAGAQTPSQEQIIAAFENLAFEGVGGTVRMALGKGHQAASWTTPSAPRSGRAAHDCRRQALSAEVNPPDEERSLDQVGAEEVARR